jgi:hypothetical protein
MATRPVKPVPKATANRPGAISCNVRVCAAFTIG